MSADITRMTVAAFAPVAAGLPAQLQGSQLAERAAAAPSVLVLAMPSPHVAVAPLGLKVAVRPGPQLAKACWQGLTLRLVCTSRKQLEDKVAEAT